MSTDPLTDFYPAGRIKRRRRTRDQVEALDLVEEVHDVHFWSLDGARHVLSLHVVVTDLSAAFVIKENVRQLSHALGDCHLTIEIESTREHCHDDCEDT